MAKRTPEEIRAQREAWLAKKAAKDAVPAEEPGGSTKTAIAEASAAEETPQPLAEAIDPESPKQKRSPEEIKAQREAFLAAKAAKAAGAVVPAPAKAEASVAAPTAKAAPKTAPQTKPAAAAPTKPRPKAGPIEAEADSTLTRREFLNYAWLASITLLSAQTVGLALWFAFPNFKAGQFGGTFPVGQASEVLPEVNSGPVPYTDGKFWLVNVDTEVNGQPRKGVLAIYKVCTHLGCLYEWVPMTSRFECPCHGSKFQLTGDYIAGPARRSLDRFVVQAVGPNGSIKETDADGKPLVVNPDDTLIVDTGKRILGTSDITPA
jgi:cytochrome b6-f complex iron-sulfur subunit